MHVSGGLVSSAIFCLTVVEAAIDEKGGSFTHEPTNKGIPSPPLVLLNVRLQKRAPMEDIHKRLDTGKQKMDYSPTSSTDEGSSAGKKRKPHYNTELSAKDIQKKKKTASKTTMTAAEIAQYEERYRHHLNKGRSNMIKAIASRNNDRYLAQNLRNEYFQRGVDQIGEHHSDKVYRSMKKADAWSQQLEDWGFIGLEDPRTVRRWRQYVQWPSVSEEGSLDVLVSKLKEKLKGRSADSKHDPHDIESIQGDLVTAERKLLDSRMKTEITETKLRSISHKASSEGHRQLTVQEEDLYSQILVEHERNILESRQAQVEVKRLRLLLQDALDAKKYHGIKPRYLKGVPKVKAQLQALKEDDLTTIREIADDYKSKAEKRRLSGEGSYSFRSLRKHHLWNLNADRVANAKAANDEAIAGSSSRSNPHQQQRQTVKQEIDAFKDQFSPTNLRNKANAHLVEAQKLRSKIEAAKREQVGVEQKPDKRLSYQQGDVQPIEESRHFVKWLQNLNQNWSQVP